jgi:hypothetical protein
MLLDLPADTPWLPAGICNSPSRPTGKKDTLNNIFETRRATAWQLELVLAPGLHIRCRHNAC